MSDQPSANAGQDPPDAGGPRAALVELRIQPATVVSCVAPPPLGTLTLSNHAPPGGITVSLATDHPTLVAVPLAVQVPEGTTTAIFQLSVSPPTESTDVVVTALYDGVTRTATLTAVPAEIQKPAETAIVPAPEPSSAPIQPAPQVQ